MSSSTVTTTPSSETPFSTPGGTTTTRSSDLGLTSTTSSSIITSSSSATSSTSSTSTTPTTTSTTSTTSSTTSTTSTTTSTTSTSSSTSIAVVTQTLTVTTSVTTSSGTPTATNTLPAGNGHASGFFSNKGAVAGVFTVVGLIGLALVALFFVTLMKQRKARQLDKEIAAAAAEANFQAGRAQFEDDEFSGDPYSGQSYYSASAGTHGAYGQPPVAHGQWDPYNSTSYSDHPAGVGMGPAAYPMQNTSRFSAGTGTTAGMAGFGVAVARGGGGGEPDAGYYGGPRSTGHEDTAQYGYPQPQPQPSEYYNSYGQGQPPAAADIAGAGASLPTPAADEKYDDPYGGEAEDYGAPQQPQQPAYVQELHRQDSSGTYDDEHEMQPRTLKVANE